MTGAVLNAAGIVVGGLCALIARRPIPALYQSALKIVVGVFAVWFGLKLVWSSINGTFAQATKEVCIVLLAMTLGRAAGKLMRLQKVSNSVGRYASSVMASPNADKRFSEGFVMATALFCAGPLAILASVHEGLTGFSPAFLVKAATDGLATYAFCSTFGWGAIVSCVPVLAYEGALIRGAQLCEPVLSQKAWPLIDAVNAVDGLMIFCVAMIILELKKIPVADYYPSLALAPLLAWWLW